MAARLTHTMTIAMQNHVNGEQNGSHISSVSQSHRILSIQSHVAFGYVGGKAAVFPLQCMGYDVDVVNSVNFSSHSGYGHFGGRKTSGEELTRILESMQQSGLLVPNRLLTGYIPNADSLQSVHELVNNLKTSNPDLVYLLDPVLGDSGKLYVAENCVSVYRQMLPLATIIAPNWFEVEALTEVPLTDLKSLRTALRKLHKTYRVPNIVISSIPLNKLSITLPPSVLPIKSSDGETDDQPSYLLCIASSLNDKDDHEGGPLSTIYARCVECIPGYFSGVGDLFSALLLGHFNTPVDLLSSPPSISTLSKPASPLEYAASHALSKTHAMMRLTNEFSSKLSLPATDDELDARDPGRQNKRMMGRELRIIQGQEIFRRKEWDQVERMGVWEGFWED